MCYFFFQKQTCCGSNYCVKIVDLVLKNCRPWWCDSFNLLVWCFVKQVRRSQFGKTFLIENFSKGENTGTKKGLVRKMQIILAQFSVQFNLHYITLSNLISFNNFTKTWVCIYSRTRDT